MKNTRKTQIHMTFLCLAIIVSLVGFLATIDCRVISHFTVSANEIKPNAPNLSANTVEMNTTRNANETEASQDAIDLENLGKVSHPQIQTIPTPELKIATFSPAPNYATAPTQTKKEMMQTTFEPKQIEPPKPTAKPSTEPIIASSQIAYSTPNMPWPSPASVPTYSKQILAQEITVSAIIVAFVSIVTIVIIKRQKVTN